MKKVLCKKDEEIIQCYIWGLNTIWDVRTGISNNHNTDYDLDEVYDYLDMFFDKNDALRKIDELEINSSLKVDVASFKYYLKKIVNGSIQIIDVSRILKIKRETIHDYLIKVGYSRTIRYDDWKTQLMLEKVVNGKIQKTSAPKILGSDYTKFIKMLERYEKEKNL